MSIRNLTATSARTVAASTFALAFGGLLLLLRPART
jgi:hypothetical protein